MLTFLNTQHIMLYPIIPFIGALLSAITFNIKIARNIAILFSLTSFFISAIPTHFLSSEYSIGGWLNYIGINFHIWDKSFVLISLVNFIFLFTLIFEHRSLENFVENRYDRSKIHLLYSLLQLAQAGFIGILVTQDFFTLYVFIEISSLSSYALISMSVNRMSIISALDYLILGTVGATLILIGVGIILKTTGHLNIIQAYNNIKISKGFQIGIMIYIIGALLKLAFFPIHSWMISAYKNVYAGILTYIGSVSAVIATYILYELIHLFLKDSYYQSLFSLKEFLYYFSGLVMIFFSYCAFLENNLRKILLFSSVMYAGYFIMMIVSGISSKVLIYYLVVTAIIKMGLFHAVSILEKNNIGPYVNDYLAIGKSSKIFAVFCTILVISNSGLPLTSGFLAKTLLLKDLSRLECYYGIFAITISSAIALLYNYKILIPIFQSNSLMTDGIKNIIKLSELEKSGLFIIISLQFLLIFLPNFIESQVIANFLITTNYTYIFLCWLTLIIIILFGSFITNYRLRLSFLSGLSIINMIVIIYVAYNYFNYNSGNILQLFIYKIGNFELLSFALDQYSLIYLVLLSILWPISIIYTSSYLVGYKQSSERFVSKDNRISDSVFILFINLCIVSASFIAIAGNLITMFSFYEILSLSTIPLIAYSCTEEAYRALYKYLKLLFIPSTLFFLLAIFLVYALCNDGSFIDNIGILTNTLISDSQVICILFLFILGISKTATLPFYSWLPAAMIAPHPVSAILHAVAVVNSGIFCFAKIVIYIFGIDYLREISISQYLILIPLIAIIVSSIIALYQNSIKQILAYSTIAQMNIMLASILSFTKIGIIGFILHMIAHSLTKLLLFFKAGDIYIASKANKIEEMDGLDKKMPISYIMIFIASLSLAGVPVFPSYFTKKEIINSFNEINIYAICILKVSTFFTCLYLSKILYYMSRKKQKSKKIFFISWMQYLAGYIILSLIIAISIIVVKNSTISFYDFIQEITMFGLAFLSIKLWFSLDFHSRIKEYISFEQFSLKKRLISDKIIFFLNKNIKYFNNKAILISNSEKLNPPLYATLGLLIIFILFI